MTSPPDPEEVAKTKKPYPYSDPNPTFNTTFNPNPNPNPNSEEETKRKKAVDIARAIREVQEAARKQATSVPSRLPPSLTKACAAAVEMEERLATEGFILDEPAAATGSVTLVEEDRLVNIEVEEDRLAEFKDTARFSHSVYLAAELDTVDVE